MMSITATPNNFQDQSIAQNMQPLEVVNSRNIEPSDCRLCKVPEELDLDSITYIEDENPFNLGFDTADYLPEGFDPYKVYVDLDAIHFIEAQDTDELGFDTTTALPENFDPYAAPTDFRSVSYLEVEEDFYPEIDTHAWLPQGFDPYLAPEKQSGAQNLTGIRAIR